MSFDIALVKINDDLDDNFNTFEKYIKIITTSNNDLIQTITDNLMNIYEEPPVEKPECIGFIMHESFNHIYQLLHLKDNTLRKNIFSSYFTSNQRLLYGNTIMLKMSITNDRLCHDDSITINDIKMIYESKMIHKGILVKYDGDMVEFTYKKSPSEFFMEKDLSQPQMHDYRINMYGFDLIIYYALYPSNNVNKKVTKLLGQERVMGDVIIVHVKYDLENNSCEPLDITITEINKLLSLCDGSDRTYDDSETLVDGKVTVNNKYNIIEQKINSYKLICPGCEQEIKHKFLCSGCYQVMYDSEECQKKCWNEHKNKCLYNRPFLHQKNLS